MSIRRVVTGHDARGKSTVLIDDTMTPGQDRYVWTTGGTPADNTGTADEARVPHRLEPVASGSIFRLVEFPPESSLAGLSNVQKE